MGYGSAGTPPWVDEKRVEEEEQKKKAAKVLTKLKVLERENKELKKRVADLEAEVTQLKK
jgi:predicted RNase H-like nuclease (RuvC/YqgF family)